jgi:DNA (cytosine-5)-methyltransferase 1
MRIFYLWQVPRVPLLHGCTSSPGSRCRKNVEWLNMEQNNHPLDGHGKYRVVSLFSGAGGMDTGLERTGQFITVACVELEKPYCNTLRSNRDAGRLGTRDTRIFEGDISELDPYKVMEACGLEPGELDLLAGGPPCQTFSTAGRRGTVQDTQGMLLWEFARFVAALKPKFFLMENVRGLLSAAIRHRPIKDRPDKGGPPLEPEEKPGSVVDLWLSDLSQASEGEYRVDCFEVNAVNYGAPQLRERVLFFGNRLGHLVDFPAPTHGNAAEEPANGQVGLFSEEELLPFATLGDALDTVEEDDGEIMDFSPRKKGYLAQVPEGANWRALPEKVQVESMGRAWYAKGGRSGWWRRLSRDLPCPTVVTMPNHASSSMCHPTETRALTLKECAAVQEFPADWEFCGTTTQKYAQVGNAVPVRLAEVAGGVLATHLDLAASGEAAGRAGASPPFRRVYLKSHIRTRQWYKAGETFVWADGADNSHAAYSAKGRGRAAVGVGG